jgi:adenine-specific DNA-methyltransferase
MWKGNEIWPEKQWQWSKERVEKALVNDELVIKNDNGKWSVRYKQYLHDEDGTERGAKLYSVFNGPWSQEGTAEIEKYFGDGKIFPFPKPTKLIKQLISCIWQEQNAIVLDFFAGSCPTAQAVYELSCENPGACRYIMVQLPESTPEDSSARKAGYKTIAEIGKERIRRVIASMRKEKDGKLALKNGDKAEDLGFKVFKLAESNYKIWTGVESKEPDAYADQMAMYADPLVPGWAAEKVIWEVAVKEGFGLNSLIKPVGDVKECSVFKVTDPAKEQCFRICLDDIIKPSTVRSLGLGKDDLFICRDAALTDETAANLALQCRLKTI